MEEILIKTCFSPRNEPLTDKLCFSVVLKHFCGDSQRSSLFCPKMTISEMSTEILRKLVFLNNFEKRKILRKIWIVLTFFLIKSVK